MKKLLIILTALTLFSCKTNKPVVTASTERIIIDRQVDTVLYSKQDSSTILALIECDSLGNAYLSQILELKAGKAIKPEIIVRENTIRLNCIVDSMAVYARMQKHFESKTDTASTVITVYQDRPKSIARKFSDGLLLIFIGAIIALAGFLLLKKRWV